ncbi:hypothetical protein [Brevibacillus sp. HB2.2]|uniref:hypothetical protein n=1 Tax=Brevibacillus sp. HB2.2 TaxID=2738846 RepID=UPI00156BA7F1|nr:hypothetical protein [Brevibacillus sp. HB2.2]NRS52052.1 hypothetical protein [Brevibacillus sp. HB2.2]
MANQSYAEKNYLDVARAISLWLNDKDDILEKGAQVSDETYVVLREILVTISEWDYMLLNMNELDEIEREKRHAYYLESLHEGSLKASSRCKKT